MKYFTSCLYIIFILFLLNSPGYSQKATAEFITSISPPSINHIPVKDGERYVTYRNNRIFIVNQWAGIQILDISDIHNPRELGFIRTKEMVHHIAFHNDQLFVANESKGVVMYDVSDVTRPVQVARIKTPGDAYWVDVDYPYLYVAMGMDGFAVMDITEPETPRTLSLEIPGSWVWSLAHDDKNIYVAAKQGGLLIYDKSDLSNLHRLSQYKTGYQVIQLQLQDNLAYIADGPGGLLVLDISTPDLPKEVGRYRSRGFTRHVFKSGNYAYLSNREMGLLIINVTDPARPYLEGQHTPDSETYCSYKQDVYVFLVTDTKTEILRHNNQPVLEPISDVEIGENTPYVLQLKAYDPDGDPIKFSAENLPEGSLFDPATGRFSWTPTYDQSGVYSGIVFRVTEDTESKLFDADTITITVKHVNRLPDLPALANVTIPEDSLLVINIPEASDPDKEDVGRLTYRAENLPPGAVFDSLKREFRWKPTFDQSGTYIVDFLAEDGSGGVDREAVTITVRHVDRPPVIQPIADQTVDEGKLLTVQLSGEEPDKEDQDKIEFFMPNLPEGAVFDPATAQFSWTPTYDQSGVYPDIIAIMKAGELSDTTRFTITVNHVNRPPVLEPIADQTVDEGNLLAFRISGSDPDKEDAGKLTFTAENLPEGAVFDVDSLVFRWTPTFDQSGSYPDVTFAVIDPQGLSDRKSITITVNHVNRPPVLAEIPPFTVNENEILEYQLTASDPDREDAGKLIFSAQGLPSGARLDSVSGKFNWTPTFDQSGSYPITFTVSDVRLSDSKSTTITVNHVNRPPVLEPLANQTVDENQLLSFTVSGSDPDKEDAGKLVFAAQNLPEGATFDPATHTFNWTPTFEQSGNYPNIVFTVTDPQGLTDEKTITITVNHVNRPPHFLSVPEVSVAEMEAIHFTLTGEDPDKEDAGKLRFSIDNLPEGAALNSTTGAFTWTPTYDQSGEYSLVARISDPAGLAADTIIHITVRNVNRPPIIEPLSLVNGKENTPLSIALRYSDPDREDAGKLVVTTTGLPEGAELNAASGIISWTPTFDQSGEYTINYIVTDSFGATAEGSVTIRVENVNRAPSLPEVGTLETEENEPLNTTLPEGSDPDKEDTGKLQYDLQNLPAGASFDPATRALQWQPDYNQAGEYHLVYVVTDPAGASATRDVLLKVKNVNRPPVAPEVASLSASEGKEISVTLPEASDPDREDAGKLQYRLHNLPKGARFEADSRTLKWTPEYDQAGSYSLTYEVKDASGASSQSSFTIEVRNVNRPPVLNDIGNKSVKEGKTVSFTVKASDPDKEDKGKLRISAEGLPQGAHFDEGSGKFSWTPGSNQQGEYRVTFRVSDPGGLSDQKSVTITVEDVPAPGTGE